MSESPTTLLQQRGGRTNSWIEVSLKALQHNTQILQKHCEPLHLLAVVKADAYSHGIKHVVPMLWQLGVRFYGVESVLEGISLRKLLPEAQILVMGAFLPEECPALIEHSLLSTLSTASQLQALESCAQKLNRDTHIHLKVDTGMSRAGCVMQELPALLQQLERSPHVQVKGVYSHLATADKPQSAYFHQQLQTFKQALHMIRQHRSLCEQPLEIHIDNSAGALLSQHQKNLGCTMVRLGLALWGVSLETPWRLVAGTLQPVLCWKSRVTLIKRIASGSGVSYGCIWKATRPTTLAVIPVGYRMGLDRRLSNNGDVLIAGQRCPLIGNVCMDQVLIDITDHPQHIAVGQVVTLIGQELNAVSQSLEQITVEEHAARTGRIPHEVLCSLRETLQVTDQESSLIGMALKDYSRLKLSQTTNPLIQKKVCS